MLRPYQREALEALQLAYRRGVHKAIISMATGLGKTEVFSALPKILAPHPNDAMLVLAHRDELIDQAIKRITQGLPQVRIGREKAEMRARSDCDIVVASVQTLHDRRIDEFFERFNERFGVLVIDECHHAVTSSYTRIIDRIVNDRPDAAVVGFTATVERADRKPLGNVFEEVVYHRDLRWAVEEGWLVMPSCFLVETQTDISEVPSGGGDFILAQLGKAVNTEERNAIIVDAYQRHLAGKKTIVFCTTVAHAEAVCDAFRSVGISSAWASGDTPTHIRKQVLADFRSGKVQVLVNCMLWVEGFDEPSTEAIINARPSEFRSVYIQIVGRGTRPHPAIANQLGALSSAKERRALIAASPKPAVMVLDLMDRAKRTLVSIPSLFGLPPKMNLHGASIDEALAKWEQLAIRDPEAAKKVEDIAQIETSLRAVDAFTIRKDPQLEGNADMAWILHGNDTYSLSMPARWKAGDRDINAEFVRAYRQAREEAREGAHERACRMLELDPAIVRSFRERLEIRPGIIAEYEVIIERGGEQRILGSVDGLHVAFTRAEHWVANNRPDARETLLATASWREKPPTSAQIELLTKDLQVPYHLVPNNRGDASRLITQMADDRHRRPSA